MTRSGCVMVTPPATRAPASFFDCLLGVGTGVSFFTSSASFYLRAGPGKSRSSISDSIQYARNGIHRTLYIVFRGLPVADTHTHRAPAAPCCTAEKSFAGLENRRNHLVGTKVMILIRSASSRIEKSHQALIDYGLPNHLRPRQASHPQHQ